MQKTDKLTRYKHDIQHDELDMEARQSQRKEKQKYWWVLTESVLAGIAWNG
ncbi:MAG: hypothetical protein GXP13_01745 [Gammaproteobacteria bacterium]|nr:hypothetical protein [Gammaproteobacteria bacterium]